MFRKMNPLLCLFAVLVLAGSAFAEMVPVMSAPGGVPDYADAPGNGTLKAVNTLTIEAWVRPTAWRSYSGREKHGLAIVKKVQIGVHADYALSLEMNGYLIYSVTSGGLGINRPVAPLNTWTHVAVTVKDTPREIHFYVNGVEQTDVAGFISGGAGPADLIQPSDIPVYVGGFYQYGWPYNNDNFIGQLCDVRVWNVMRSGADIAANYNKRLIGNEPGLVGYWDFIGGWTDKSGDGNHLTPRGAASIVQMDVPISGVGSIDVEITSPTNNAVFLGPLDIPVDATATNSNGVSKVEFFVNGTKRGEDTTEPYAYLWTNVQPGSYQLEARGTNAFDQTGSSEAVSVRVRGVFGGVTAAVPGNVEVENFDLGGQGLCYNDTTPANQGGVYRPTEGVDIAADAGASNGFLVGWGAAGEWIEYTVDVLTSRLYEIRARVASPGAGGTFHVEVDGANLTGTMNVPDTGGWFTYGIAKRSGINLTAGSRTVRLVLDGLGPSGWVGNFDQLQFVPWEEPWYPLPGCVEAEDFRLCGEGIAYHDTTAGNFGGQYRPTEDVDISASAGASNGYLVGWVKATEWLEYKVDIQTAGTYELCARAASLGVGGTFRVLIDGSNVTGTLTVPDTGGWLNWTGVKVGNIDLTAGQKIMRVEMLSNGPSAWVGNFDVFCLSTWTPPGPPELPGCVEIEDFDQGGEGVGYHDTTPANLGGVYRPAEGVDIAAAGSAGNGYLVGWTKATEWLNYTVDVQTSGTYTVNVRAAALGAGGTFNLTVDGIDVTGPMQVPNTGGWFNWAVVSKAGVNLTVGTHTARVVMASDGAAGWVGNFDRMCFVLSTPLTPVPGILEAEDFDGGGEGVGYHDTTPANLGGAYRPAEGVDIAAHASASNGNLVGWTKATEWLNFGVYVASAGNHEIAVRVASSGAGGTFHVTQDGTPVGGAMTVPNTGGWMTWQTVAVTGYLSQGSSVIRVVMDTDGATGYVGNFDQIRVSAIVPPPPSGGSAPPAPSAAGGASAAPVSGSVASARPIDVRTSDPDETDTNGWAVVDGDLATAWTPAQGLGGYIALVYGDILPVGSVSVVWGEQSPTNVTVLYSMDAEAWGDLGEAPAGEPVEAMYLWLIMPPAESGVAPTVQEVIVE